jgi:3-hydroxyisobutyrate dehydrogenase-like beta-hydroxyacid dehydrogenase
VADRAGVEVDTLLEVVSAGSGSSAMLDLKARPMLERDLEPLFKLEHMLKDVRHFLAEARELGVETPVAARAAQVYGRADERGLGERDFAAVIEVADDPEGAAAEPGPPPRAPERTPEPPRITAPRGFRP